MAFSVGDRVQLKNGAMDVTTGVHAVGGRMYGEGGPLWAVIQSITDYETKGAFDLPWVIKKVTLVAENSDLVVWRVRESDIADNYIRSSEPELVQTDPDPVPSSPRPTAAGTADLSPTRTVNEDGEDISTTTRIGSAAYYRPTEITTISNMVATGAYMGTIGTLDAQVGAPNNLGTPIVASFDHLNSGYRDLTDEERSSIGANMQIDDSAANGPRFPLAYEDETKRAHILGDNSADLQNQLGYPAKIEESDQNKGTTAKYDYQIIPGDTRYSNMVSLEDKLTQMRASLGIPVHGNNNTAKAMKLLMYNRFKVPDPNLAFNKATTHVFFTRPDLNLLTCGVNPTPVTQVKNHSDATMIWNMHPELFKLLTDRRRCGDDNNFNFLLSQQVNSFNIKEETISSNRVGKSWNDAEMIYGDFYSGVGPDTFTCEFTETQDFHIIHLMRLWLIYIDNVARGIWSPSYNLYGSSGISHDLNGSHVYTKTIDYMASVYVFKVAPNGEDILYWTKYYGVFPSNTGADALSWSRTNSIGDTPNPSITFNYVKKRDMSPISLIEFNTAANIDGTPTAEASFNPEYGHSSRPFTGCPFVDIQIQDPINSSLYMQSRTSIKLKFKTTDHTGLTDDMLYSYSPGNSNVTYYENSTSTGRTTVTAADTTKKPDQVKNQIISAW